MGEKKVLFVSSDSTRPISKRRNLNKKQSTLNKRFNFKNPLLPIIHINNISKLNEEQSKP